MRRRNLAGVFWALTCILWMIRIGGPLRTQRDLWPAVLDWDRTTACLALRPSLSGKFIGGDMMG
eukprot:6278371-Karenia_brevis.AAC.1